MARNLLFSVTKDDCDWQTFTCGGKGGSGKDTSNNGVRCIHRASGAAAEARDSRNQLRNRRAAFIRMSQTPEFKSWHKLEVARHTGALAEMERVVSGRVEALLKSEKDLKIEYYAPS